MANIIQHKRGTASQWTTLNPLLAAGEIGLETDTGKFKFGDGVNYWNSLNYADKETIDWGSITGTLSNQTDLQNALDLKANISSLATVATSGSYDDLSNKPTIPTVNNATLTIQKNGTTVDTFTANASSNVTANITVPTDTSDLTNNAGYITGITSSDVTTALGYTPYDSTNPNGYTSNVGTVTSVNNTSPDANGNVTITIPDSATWGNITGTLSNQTDLKNALDAKQDAIQAIEPLVIGAVSSGGSVNFTFDTVNDVATNTYNNIKISGGDLYNDTLSSSVSNFDDFCSGNVSYIDIPLDLASVYDDAIATGAAKFGHISVRVGALSDYVNTIFIFCHKDEANNITPILRVNSDISSNMGTMSVFKDLYFTTYNSKPDLRGTDFYTTSTNTYSTTEKGFDVGFSFNGSSGGNLFTNVYGSSRRFQSFTADSTLINQMKTVNMVRFFRYVSNSSVTADTYKPIISTTKLYYNDVAASWTMADAPTTFNNLQLNYGSGLTVSGGNLVVTGKQDTLVSGTNIKTVNNTSLLGSGNISVQPVIDANNKLDYSYLSNTPTIPTVNNATLTITQGGVSKGTFTANASSDVTIALDAGGGGSVDIDNLSITENSSNKIQTVGVIDNRSGSAIKTWTGTRQQYDAILSKDANTLYNITDDTDITLTLLEALYPVGSIYIGTMANCPLATLGVGTWQLVATDRVLQGAGTRGSVGTTVNESLPNITGRIQNWSDQGVGSSSLSGAFYEGETKSKAAAAAANTTAYVPMFDASRSSSTYQNDAPVQQDAYLVNIWERTV